MASTSRFECASSLLRLGRILRTTQRALWLFFALGMAAHLSLTQIRGLEAEQKVAKPLTTQFVKRQPRLSKPLELKKRPQPKRRRIQRKMVSVRARVGEEQTVARFQPSQVMQGLVHPRIGLDRALPRQVAVAGPHSLAEVIEGRKEAKDEVDMSLEMVDIDALDTGKYHALVVQDPDDKRNTRGYLHIVHAYPRSIVNSVETSGGIVISVVALRGLVEAMNKYTQIKTDLGGRYTFDAKELMKIPFVLTSSGGFSFDHTVSEAENLGRYLLDGGFYIADCRHPAMGPERPSSQSFRRFIEAGLRSQGVALGRDWDWEKLPNSHPLYHCYFDFPGGPPPGVDNLSQVRFDPVDHLEGVTWGGRLMAILSLKAYTAIWEVDASSGWGNRDNTRQRQFGVNLIIFALTQEDSITRRLMDSVE